MTITVTKEIKQLTDVLRAIQSELGGAPRHIVKRKLGSPMTAEENAAIVAAEMREQAFAAAAKEAMRRSVRAISRMERHQSKIDIDRAFASIERMRFHFAMDWARGLIEADDGHNFETFCDDKMHGFLVESYFPLITIWTDKAEREIAWSMDP